MKTPFKILVVEDSTADWFILEKALQLIEDIELDVTCVKNGQEGLDYVFKVGKYAGETTPDVIILDLNLPVKNGFEVLEAIKNDALCRLIPIIIYSTSDESGDICASYSLYANSYITKTSELPELFEKIKCFGKWWAKSVVKPDIDYYSLTHEERK